MVISLAAPLTRAIGWLSVCVMSIGGQVGLVQAQAGLPWIPEEALFLDVRTMPDTLHVQSQLIYILRVFRSIEILEASLTELKTSASDAVIERLGDDKNFETERHGVRYRVVERRYAIFPQRSGSLTIMPVQLEARLSAPSRGGGKGGGGAADPEPLLVQRHSAAVALVVEPIPPDFSEGVWLPGRQLQLEETWSVTPPLFQVGTPITRTLTLFANGLTSAQLPSLVSTAGTRPDVRKARSEPLPEPPLLNRYPDPPVLTDKRGADGIIGMRRETITMTPAHVGRLTLPAIEIPWWNIDTQTREVAYAPERQVEITMATLPGATVAIPNQQSVTFDGSDGSPSHHRTGHENGQPATTLDSRAQRVEGEGQAAGGGDASAFAWSVASLATWTYMPVLVMFFAVAWVVTALVCRYLCRRDLRGEAQGAHQARGWRRSPHDGWHDGGHDGAAAVEKQLKQLKRVCLHNDPIKCRALLLSWAQARWPETALHNLNDLQALLIAHHDAACADHFFSAVPQKGGQSGRGEGVRDHHLDIAALAQEIVSLNQSLFSALPRHWQGKPLWDRVCAIQAAPRPSVKASKALPPLYHAWP